MERVTIIRGSAPLIVVAPYAAEQDQMRALVLQLCQRLDACAVMNQAFKRSGDVDVLQDKADCNRLDHLQEDVVKDEFLLPLLAFKRNLIRRYGQVFILHLSVVDPADHPTNNIMPDLVLGYGQAVVNPSVTCQGWMVDMFLHEWKGRFSGRSLVYCGKPGGPYSARSVHHLPQAFRKLWPTSDVDAMQIHVYNRNVANPAVASACGSELATVMERIIAADGFNGTIDRWYF